ncbi:ketoacyl-ACP synthase III [Bordetella holmesii]|nr:ketoacyl-ACP synthase III [Bordetella holmesii]AHV91988.1 putative 3-oxoacyl-[acyl-carrier-(ACP)] synthase [Bordetella holmesii ATCC 51541]AMD45525.1 3-oxoacyl-ACP synthase [Bordetella holmesii H558]AMD49044.1 3-oxoacyl-ACP synthase [Bordetella holmesii F627]EWM44034.1 3-Oxoacyl-[acyl-carrier-(ACP)] synthase family protein [Bordetella holmesii 41130]EWM47108.1 3-Oxoacyl-[acyl-carrier-(ACP)] synthase family protein [Bordetella holmesii 35009]EXF90123.1 3-oxoacyl-[acyl-carrier-(ACP)] synthas
MGVVRLDHVAVRGITSAVPPGRVDNLAVAPDQLAQRERLVRNVGVRWRPCCADGMIFSDLAQHAAQKLIDGLGWDKASIDALILVTQSPEFSIPATSIILQDRLGLPLGVSAFDINLGCSGYTYGIFNAAAMVGEQRFRRVLVLVGDQAASNDGLDNGRDILFGDACTATALEYDPTAQPIYFEGFSDGSGYEAIIIPHGGKRYPTNDSSRQPRLCADGVMRRADDVWLDGPAILTFSTLRAPEAIRRMLGHVGKDVADIDYYVMHQANRMINNTIRQKVGGSPAQWPSSLEQYGNTSSASIPVTISSQLSAEAQQRPLHWILCGFGIGLSWGTLYLQTEPFYAPEPFVLEHRYDFQPTRIS